MIGAIQFSLSRSLLFLRHWDMHPIETAAMLQRSPSLHLDMCTLLKSIILLKYSVGL